MKGAHGVVGPGSSSVRVSDGAIRGRLDGERSKQGGMTPSSAGARLLPCRNVLRAGPSGKATVGGLVSRLATPRLQDTAVGRTHPNYFVGHTHPLPLVCGTPPYSVGFRLISSFLLFVDRLIHLAPHPPPLC